MLEGVGVWFPPGICASWIYLVFCVGRSEDTAEDPAALVIDICRLPCWKILVKFAMGKATKILRKAAFLSGSHTPHTHTHHCQKNTEKSQEHPGNTLTRARNTRSSTGARSMA